jgi:rod shape-determining protein MreC
VKNFLKENGLWILFAAAVISVVLAVMTYFANTSSPLVNLAGILSSPFRSAYSAVAGWVSEQRNYFADNQALREENQALRNRIAEMEREIRQAKDDSEENRRLRELLDLREKRRDFEFESAAVLQRSTSNWISSLDLNRGTAHGVEVNDCVVTEQGYLVGYSIGYADQIGGKTQASQSLAGSLNPYRYGNARWKGFMMGFPAGYEEGLTAETAG